MGNDAGGGAPTPLEELEWADVREPGCYLHVATGLLARLRAGDAGSDVAVSEQRSGAGWVVRLSSDPDASLTLLRRIATGARYLVRF